MLHKNVYTYIGFLSVLLWSTSTILCRSIGEVLGPFLFIGIIYTSMGLCILLLQNKNIMKTFQLPRSYLFGIGSTCLCLVFCNTLGVYYAVNHEQVIIVTILYYTWPPLTSIMSVKVLGYSARKPFYLGIILVVAGVAFSICRGEVPQLQISYLISYILSLFSAIFFTIYNVYSKKIVPNISIYTSGISLFQIFTGVSALFIAYFNNDFEKLNLETIPIYEIIYSIFGPGVFGILFWELGIRNGNTVFLSIAGLFIPLFSVQFSFYFLIGVGLVILGGFIEWKYLDSHESQPNDPNVNTYNILSDKPCQLETKFESSDEIENRSCIETEAKVDDLYVLNIEEIELLPAPQFSKDNNQIGVNIEQTCSHNKIFTEPQNISENIINDCFSLQIEKNEKILSNSSSRSWNNSTKIDVNILEIVEDLYLPNIEEIEILTAPLFSKDNNQIGVNIEQTCSHNKIFTEPQNISENIINTDDNSQFIGLFSQNECFSLQIERSLSTLTPVDVDFQISEFSPIHTSQCIDILLSPTPNALNPAC